MHSLSVINAIRKKKHVTPTFLFGTDRYYSGTVLKMAGFPAKSAVWLVVLPNALLFIAGFIAVFVVDRMGRRPLLIGSMIGKDVISDA